MDEKPDILLINMMNEYLVFIEFAFKFGLEATVFDACIDPENFSYEAMLSLKTSSLSAAKDDAK